MSLVLSVAAYYIIKSFQRLNFAMVAQSDGMGCDSRLIKVSQCGYMRLNLNHALDLLGSSLSVDSTIDEYLY